MEALKNNWKEKAKKRRYENKNLKKRIRDLTKSRNNWKNKVNNIEEELNNLKKK